MTNQEIKNRSFSNPIAVIVKDKGVYIFNEYYLFGRKVPLHEFKRRCKALRPIQIITLERAQYQEIKYLKTK